MFTSVLSVVEESAKKVSGRKFDESFDFCVCGHYAVSYASFLVFRKGGCGSTASGRCKPHIQYKPILVQATVVLCGEG